MSLSINKMVSPDVNLLPPIPVSLGNLQRHFKEKYGFSPSQTEIMVESSAMSLVQVFENAFEALKQENLKEHLAPVFHGLKGLLLNMGEDDWAAFAREVEQKLEQGVGADYNRIVAEMQVGMADILVYNRDKGKENS